jgi:hypothetical protein
MLVLGLNHARDVSLNTNVVTQPKQQTSARKTTALSPSLFFCPFYSFFLFLRGQNSFVHYHNNQNKGITGHNPFEIGST